MRGAKIDDNHAAIVRALRQIPGVSVRSTARLGEGFGDIVAGRLRVNYIFEVKKDAKKKLTDAEKEFSQTWKGQYDVITSAKEALKIMGINL